MWLVSWSFGPERPLQSSGRPQFDGQFRTPMTKGGLFSSPAESESSWQPSAWRGINTRAWGPWENLGLVGELEDVMAAARLWAADAQPYLATALFAMSITATPGLTTMATDRYWRLYVDPPRQTCRSVEQLGSVMIHEAHHLIRDHAERSVAAGSSEGPDAFRFNVAADLEINDDLRSLPLPHGGLQPDQFGLPDGLLAEDYLLQLGERLPELDCGSGAHGEKRWWETEQKTWRSRRCRAA